MRSIRASLMRISSIRRATSCRSRSFSCLSRIRAFQLFAAQLRVWVSENWASEIAWMRPTGRFAASPWARESVDHRAWSLRQGIVGWTCRRKDNLLSLRSLLAGDQPFSFAGPVQHATRTSTERSGSKRSARFDSPTSASSRTRRCWGRSRTWTSSTSSPRSACAATGSRPLDTH